MFDEQGNIAINKKIGKVELVKSGAKSTMLHGFGKAKIAAITAIKPVIENGDIVFYAKQYDEDSDRYIIAGKGKIDGENAVVGVVVKSYLRNGVNKFYLHEAEIIKAELSSMTGSHISEDTVNNSASDPTVTQKSPSVNSILSENPKKITTESKRIAENSGVKRQNKISVEMNDAERAEVLRNSAIDIVKYKGNVEDLNAANVLALQKTYRANAAPVLKKLAEKFGVFDKTYFNKNISLDFSYSRGSLKESVNKQGKVSTDFYDFAKMLYVFDDVVNNAVPIEAHTDKYAGTERANQNLKYDYVLLSAFSDGDYIIPVEMHIKEFSNKDPNKLYVSITLGKIKTEDGILAHPSKQKNISANVTPPSSKINVAQLIAKVNPGFSDFYKYIPSELLTEAQISSKTVALDDEKYRLGVLRGEDVSGMLRKKAENAGYSPDDSWKMDHRAPNADDDAALDMDTETLDFFMYNFERILNQAGTETSSETKNTAENSGVKKQAKIGETEDGRGIYKTNYAKNTPKSVKQQDIIDIVQNVWSKKPISLYITEGNTSRRITANFDPTLSERSDLAKIVYGNRKETASEKKNDS